MIYESDNACPKCGGDLRYYDRVKRIIREGDGKKRWVFINRFRCLRCKSIHRMLPDYLYPFRQYNLEVIQGVLEGYISPETLGYEDYPCEMTMNRWKKDMNLKDISKSF